MTTRMIDALRRGDAGRVALAAGMALSIGVFAGAAVAADACPPIAKKDAYTVGWAQISNNNSFRLTETESIVDEAAKRRASRSSRPTPMTTPPSS